MRPKARPPTIGAAPRRKPPHAGMGRAKGVPNKTTRSMREMYLAFFQANMPVIQSLFDRVAKSQPAKALEILGRFSEFVLPKLARIELSGPDGAPVPMTSAVVSYSTSDPREAMRVYQQMVASPDPPPRARLPQPASDKPDAAG